MNNADMNWHCGPKTQVKKSGPNKFLDQKSIDLIKKRKLMAIRGDYDSKASKSQNLFVVDNYRSDIDELDMGEFQ